MPRNRYTKAVRICERAQIARQEKDLVSLARELRRGITESTVVPLVMGLKEGRRLRLTQNRKHKPRRSETAA